MNQSPSNYKVLQGDISQLLTEAINVHFLKNIKQHKEMAGTVAMLQAAGGQAGAVVSSQAATYEGDPVEGFTTQVAGKTTRGSFWKTTFHDGDNAQAGFRGGRNGLKRNVPLEQTIHTAATPDRKRHVRYECGPFKGYKHSTACNSLLDADNLAAVQLNR